MKKLRKRSDLGGSKTIKDSLKYRKSVLTDKRFDLPLFAEARDVYLSFDTVRQTRARNIRYVFGDQWADKVMDERGRLVTERSRIYKRTGGIALQNNHLFKVVNSMAGIYVKSAGIPVVYAKEEERDTEASMMTNALQTNYERNEMQELLTQQMMELLIGGMPVLCDEWCNHDGMDDDYTFPVEPSYFAFRSQGNDPRLWDVDLMVEIRDYPLGVLKNRYGKTDSDIAQLDALYAPYLNILYPDAPSQEDLANGAAWDRPARNNLCRTYRVWTLEYKSRYQCVDLLDLEQPLYRIDAKDKAVLDEENMRRIEQYRMLGVPDDEMVLIDMTAITDTYWHCTIFGPEGAVIEEFDEEEPPYVFTAHHLMGGQIYPFISVVIDQQRYINRLITLQDLYINSSIKGLKMVPKSMLGGLTPREFAKRATELGGWIFYEPDERFPNLAPSIVQSASRDIGVSELLRIQLDSINEITSVSEALRGGSPASGTPASRFALETENAITSLAATYKKFNHFENKLARKKLKTIHKHYTTGRDISVWYTSGLSSIHRYDREAVEDIDFYAVVRQAPDTPVARMNNNDLFKEMWLRGILNTQQLLRYSDLPGTEQLKQDLAVMQEQGMGEPGQPGQPGQPGVPSQIKTDAANGANPDTVSAIKDALRNDLGALTKL